MIEWISEPYTCQDTGSLVCDGYYLNPVRGAPKWWTPSGVAKKIPLVHIAMALRKEGTCHPQLMLIKRICLKMRHYVLKKIVMIISFDEIFRRETLEHETRDEEEEKEEEEELYESGEQ
jgi:hypothetical protein